MGFEHPFLTNAAQPQPQIRYPFLLWKNVHCKVVVCKSNRDFVVKSPEGPRARVCLMEFRNKIHIYSYVKGLFVKTFKLILSVDRFWPKNTLFCRFILTKLVKCFWANFGTKTTYTDIINLNPLFGILGLEDISNQIDISVENLSSIYLRLLYLYHCFNWINFCVIYWKLKSL